MKQEEYAYLMEYCSPSSILVVTWYGKLKELHCPFGVKINNDIGSLKKGDVAFVDKVLMASDGSVVFNINGYHYKHTHFDILTHL